MLVRLENSGRFFETSDGETVLDAAERSGINLPYLAVMASVVLARLGFVVVKLTMVFTPVLRFLRKSASRDIS